MRYNHYLCLTIFFIVSIILHSYINYCLSFYFQNIEVGFVSIVSIFLSLFYRNFYSPFSAFLFGLLCDISFGSLLSISSLPFILLFFFILSTVNNIRLVSPLALYIFLVSLTAINSLLIIAIDALFTPIMGVSYYLFSAFGNVIIVTLCYALLLITHRFKVSLLIGKIIG